MKNGRKQHQARKGMSKISHRRGSPGTLSQKKVPNTPKGLQVNVASRPPSGEKEGRSFLRLVLSWEGVKNPRKKRKQMTERGKAPKCGKKED